VIKEVAIKNFKSVQELTLPLSRFNVLIGSNGSGKSNILEAIAFGAAASADKLDNEFLGSRGIRTSEIRLMKSAFNTDSYLLPIEINFKVGNDHQQPKEFALTIWETKSAVPKWITKELETLESFLERITAELSKIEEDILLERENAQTNQYSTENMNSINEKQEAQIQRVKEIRDHIKNFKYPWDDEVVNRYRTILSSFIIYSPELTALRKLEEESQIQPLGIKGEGLFNLLQIFNENYGQETINELKKYLHIIEWFDDFEAVYDKTTERKSLIVKDRYIPNLSLNQHNVNEGFLFLLFYISLIISKETPAFFAIDNIEASFHPRLCEELIKQLIELAKKHNKQLILTTQNPHVLDGLNLQDPEQSLFVIRRNAAGETIADKITKQSKNAKLSEAWIRGYIGGNPETIE
jgi:predicted ATPase